MATPIGTLGTIPTLTVGGRVFTDLENLIELSGAGSSTSIYSTLRLSGASSGYQVPVGKILQIRAVQFTATTPAVLAAGYSDTDVGYATSTAPSVNVVPYVQSDYFYTGGDTPQVGIPLQFDVPAGKYPYCNTSSGDMRARFYGYLVDA